MVVYAKSPAAANFMEMFVEEELEITSPIEKTSKGYCVELSEADAEDMISCAEEYNDIAREEWKIALDENYKNSSKRMRESTSESYRIFVAAKTAEAKEALEDAGFERSGFVFDMTAGDLAEVLENFDIDLDEIDVKDENGEPIEDVYAYVFDTDEVYDDYYEDDFEDDDEVYFDPDEGDKYDLDF